MISNYNGNGRGATSDVRELYSSLRNRTLETTARKLGVYIGDTPVFGKQQNNVERYKEILESVWIPDNWDVKDYYNVPERVAVFVADFFGLDERLESLLERKVSGRAKTKHKQTLTRGLSEMVTQYSTLMENCSAKITEASSERDEEYQRAHACESLAAKEMEYAEAFRKKEGDVKKDMRKLVDEKQFDKVGDCEKVVYDLQLNAESSMRNARHYAKQNNLHVKKTDECIEAVNYLRFLKGRYFTIVTQSRLMLEDINSHEFNMANCLIEVDRIREHNALMEGAESVVTKHEEAQERSIEVGLDNFGFASEHTGSPTLKGSLVEMNKKEQEETEDDITAMAERRDKRLERLLAS